MPQHTALNAQETRLLHGLLAFAGIYALLFVFYIGHFGFQLFFMGWNLLLAVIPLCFAPLALRLFAANRKAGASLASLVWFFFFPNAPYMLTDLLHINRFSFLTNAPPNTAFRVTTDLASWCGLMIILWGVCIGCISGYFSLHLMLKHLRRKFGRFAAHISLAVIAALSSLAIYIGRFLRFNSWDVVLNPVGLIRETFSALNGTAFLFCLLFFGVIIAQYLLFRLCFSAGSTEKQTNGDE